MLDAWTGCATLIAEAVRGRVAGPGGAERQRELYDAPGPRWFVAGSPICRVHADASMFVGGLRALLLQRCTRWPWPAWPQHSDYRADPWGRLQRTADFLAATTFGTDGAGRAACATVRPVHTRVRGRGRRRPALLGQRPAPAALGAHRPRSTASSPPTAATAPQRLTRRRGRPVRGRHGPHRRASWACPTRPRRRVAAADHRDYRHELAGTPAARERRASCCRRRCRPWRWGRTPCSAPRPSSLLPVWARRPLRLPWLPLAETFAVRPAGQALVSGLRWALVPTACSRPPPDAADQARCCSATSVRKSGSAVRQRHVAHEVGGHLQPGGVEALGGEPGQLGVDLGLDQRGGHDRAVGERGAVRDPLPQLAAARSRRWPRPPSGRRWPPRPGPPATPRGTAAPRSRCCARPRR